MLKKVQFVPRTEKSVPFAEAALSCDFAKIGYREEEYFLSGTANIYGEEKGHKAKVLYTDAPYTTRILVRRPEDPTACSGNVVVEILNATAGFDIDRMWVNSWKFFTRNGDIYVGITSKGHVVDALRRFDPERYAPICWDNPHPEREIPAWAETSGPFGILPQFELGLFWDMLTDCAKLLRSGDPENPIADSPRAAMYLTGWSQSGFYLSRYIASFHDTKNPLFDGFLSAGSGAGLMALNTYERSGKAFGESGVPAGSMLGSAQPVIAINTESENRIVNWVGDFDEPGYKFRTYQIAGASHDSRHNILDYFTPSFLRRLAEIGFVNQFPAVDGELSDYPYHLVMNIGFAYLYRWVRDGIPAPHMPKIETYMAFDRSRDAFGSFLENKTDALGNCVGGIRTPTLEYPTGVYDSWSTAADGRVSATFGKVNAFSPEKLTALYGDLAHYAALVAESAEECVAKGYLLPEDKAEMISLTVSAARSRWQGTE